MLILSISFSAFKENTGRVIWIINTLAQNSRAKLYEKKELIISVVDSLGEALKVTVVTATKKTTDNVSMFSILILPVYTAWFYPILDTAKFSNRVVAPPGKWRHISNHSFYTIQALFLSNLSGFWPQKWAFYLICFCSFEKYYFKSIFSYLFYMLLQVSLV